MAKKESNYFVNKLLKISENTEKLSTILQCDEKFVTLIHNIKFNELVNINIYDSKSLRAAATTIKFLIGYEKIYECDDHISNFLEFIIRNLMIPVENCDEVSTLLELLAQILSDYLKYHISGRNLDKIVDVERLLEALLCISKIPNFDQTTSKYCYSILDSILELCPLLHGQSRLNANRVILEIFEKLRSVGAALELCLICNKLSQRILTVSYKMVFNWLIEECPRLLSYRNNNSEELLTAALNSLTHLLENWESGERDVNIINSLGRECDLLNILLEYCADICLHSSKSRVRKQCCILLEFMTVGFLHKNRLPFPTSPSRKLREIFYDLPEAVEDWCKTDVDWFFCICHILMEYHGKNLPWKADNIPKAIECWLTKDVMDFSNIAPFRSILHIYPHFVDDPIHCVLGHNLLKLIPFNNVESILSGNNVKQLEWILMSGDDLLKFSAIRFWLNRDDQNVMAVAIDATKTQDLLFELLMRNPGSEIKLKITSLLQKVNNEALGIRIAETLPFVHKDLETFGCLLLAGPGVPPLPEETLILCGIMGAILPLLPNHGENVMKAACDYSYKLLKSLKHHPESVKMFCRNPKGLNHLIKRGAAVEDEALSIAIIELLKLLLIIQTTTGAKFDNHVRDDFAGFLRGSSAKTRSCLGLIYAMITWNDPFITMDEFCVFRIHERILDLCESDPDCALDGYKCVIALLHKENWLAMTAPVRVHLEAVFSNSAHFPAVSMFLNLVLIWLEIVHGTKNHGYVKLMSDFEMRRFLFRVSKSQKSAVAKILALLNTFPLDSK